LAGKARTTILLVENEPDLMYTITQMLETSRRYSVHSFSNPVEALEHITVENCQRCKLVITNLDMPEMSGLELARRLKQTRPTLPVILATAHIIDATEFERTMKSLGIDGFASKPFTQAQLLAAVDKLIRDLA
jgi:chemosensory pili system protein ChpA (sensor histidine kinase/response regulator)